MKISTTSVFFTLTGLTLLSTPAPGQVSGFQVAPGRTSLAPKPKHVPTTYSWRYYRPGNTGIQGDYNEAIWVGPTGDPYIGGYDPFFEEGGFVEFLQAENRWVNYSNVDYPVIGHPNDTGCTRVTDFVSDDTGKLWIGTWLGALGFDPEVGASSLVHYGPGNSTLNEDRVWDIDRAPDGSIWFSNNGSARHDPASGSWTRWDNMGNVFLSVQPKPNGGYLVWSSTRPPFRDYTFVYDSDTQNWAVFNVAYPFSTPGAVVGMPGKDCVDASGNFWALRLTAPGEFDSLDYRKPNGTWITPPEPYSGLTFGISAFCAYGDRQAVMVDGLGQVFRFEGNAWSSLGTWRPGAFTYSADVDAAGNVWVCGMGGAAKYDVATGLWQRYRITNSGNFDSFNRDLTVTASGDVYTGANAGPGVGGMVRFDGLRWTGWNNSTYGLGWSWPFQNDYCQALTYRPSSGRVVVSPLNWLYGIHEWNGSSFAPLPPLSGAQRMCEDSLGRLWAIGEYFSLSYHDGSGWTSVTPVAAWGTGIARDPTRPGTVWAWAGYEFARTDGVYRFSRTIADFPELVDNSDQFSGLAVDTNGVAWVGATDHDGSGGVLIRIDANTGAYQMLHSSQGWPFPGDVVTPWAVTPDGRLWMQYGDVNYPYDDVGLCWYDGKNVGFFPAPPGGDPQWGGLPHQQIEDLEVRVIPGGYELWMSCVSRGLAVLTVKH